jgi:type I restriction enzyme S subunit
MKETGLSWIPGIPSHWEVKRAKLILREVDSRSAMGDEVLLSVSQYTGVTPRRTRDNSDEQDTRSESLVGYKKVSSGDLVVNIMLAWNGSLGASSFDGVVSPAYCIYRFEGDNHPDYYHHLLRTDAYKGRIKVDSRGVVDSRLRLYSENLFRIELPVPPPDEQAQIVRFIRHLDQRVNRLIKTKRRLVELLNEQKQAIIHRAVTRGLDPTVPLKSTGDGDVQIPVHWERRAVMQLFSIGRGEVTSHEYIASHPGQYPLYSSQTTNDGIMGWIDTYMFDGEYLTWTTDGAHAGTVFHRLGKFNCTNVCGTLRSKSSSLHLSFMKHALGIETKSHVRIDINPKLMNNMMARIRVNVPPLDEQMQIFEYLNSELEAGEVISRKAIAEIDLIREYRTRLVADVVTGQLDVRHLDLPEVEESLIEAIDAVDSVDGEELDEQEEGDL